MEQLFIDTSAWYAYVNQRDPDHDAVASLLRGFTGRLLTSNYIFDEIVTLCRVRLGHGAAAKVGEILQDPAVTDLVRVTAGEEAAAWRLFLDRPDQSYSFTDCTSFVLLRRLGLGQAAALDADFRAEGFETVPVG